jgi:hypothetical protein
MNRVFEDAEKVPILEGRGFSHAIKSNGINMA